MKYHIHARVDGELLGTFDLDQNEIEVRSEESLEGFFGSRSVAGLESIGDRVVYAIVAGESGRALGYDHTGEWTPQQYAIDAGWDVSCVEATAEKGVSEADADGLTEQQQSALLEFCKGRVAETVA